MNYNLSARFFIISAIIFALGGIYFLFDPTTTPWMPVCLIKMLTGFDCPGCGSQRFLHYCLHLDFHAAAEANMILFLVIPYILFWGCVELFSSQSSRLYKALNSPGAIIIIILLLLIWTIIRNLPHLPFK